MSTHLRGVTLLMDWDGCLVNSLPYWKLSVIEALADLNLVATDAQLATALHQWSYLSQLGVPDLQAFSQSLYSHFRSHLKDIDLNPGAGEALEQMQQAGVTMAVVTSSPLAKVAPVAKRLALSHFFRAIITKDDVDRLKPHPEPLHLAMRQLNCLAHRTFMVGDGKVDVQASNEAGVRALWYHPDHNHDFHSNRSETALLPQFEVQHWDQMVPLLTRLTADPHAPPSPEKMGVKFG